MNPISEPILIVQRCQSHCRDFTTHHVVTDLPTSLEWARCRRCGHETTDYTPACRARRLSPTLSLTL